MGNFRNKWDKLSFRFDKCANYIEQNKFHFFKEYGLTSQQFQVLQVLYSAAEPLSIKQIKSYIYNRESDISRLTDRLLKAGWVSKTPSKKDKRVSEISLSPAGTTLVENVATDIHRLDEVFFELNKNEVKLLNSLLKKIMS